MSHLRTNTPVCAMDTYTTSPLSNSIVPPQPAVSLDLKSFGMSRSLVFRRQTRRMLVTCRLRGRRSVDYLQQLRISIVVRSDAGTQFGEYAPCIFACFQERLGR